MFIIGGGFNGGEPGAEEQDEANNLIEQAENEPIEFSDFTIDSPEVPKENDGWVTLIDEESSAINICNLTRKEAEMIIKALDPIVKEVADSGNPQEVEIKPEDKSILKLNIDFIDDRLAIEGRKYVSGGDPSGDYFHDFVIESAAIEDWQKIVELFA